MPRPSAIVKLDIFFINSRTLIRFLVTIKSNVGHRDCCLVSKYLFSEHNYSNTEVRKWELVKDCWITLTERNQVPLTKIIHGIEMISVTIGT